MAKIGRNAPCPCGSGKKYKKCCLLHVEAARVEAMLRERQQATAAASLPPSTAALEPLEHERLCDDCLHLDERSNGVLDLIEERRFDEALAGCEELRREYPDVVDGWDLAALAYEQRGEPLRAADFYRQALAFTERPDQRAGFDEEVRAHYRDRIAELERLTAAA